MGTLSSFSFSLIPPNWCKVKLQNSNNSKCFLCGEFLLKRSRRLVREGGFGRLNSVIRSCCNGENNRNDDRSSSTGERDGKKKSNLATTAPGEKKSDDEPAASVSSRPQTIQPVGPASSNFQVEVFNLMEWLAPERVDPADVKVIKDKLFGYSTFWVTREEPFGDLGEGILFLGNIRGKREDVFSKLQSQLREIMGDKYDLFMVEEPNSDGEDPRGGPRVSFAMLRKEVLEPGQTTLWQYVIAFLLFLLTIGSSVELGLASQINRLPPVVVKYFTDPNTIEPPDMQLLFPFVDSALLLAYGVLGVQLFHEVGHSLVAIARKVKLSIPYFIPNVTLGSFGAITQFKSILPDRKAKVDISLAGPFAGAALSFSMFTVGLLLSSNPSVAGDLIQDVACINSSYPSSGHCWLVWVNNLSF